MMDILNVQVSKVDMEPAKTEAMLRGTDGFDDSARGNVVAVGRTSAALERRSPGPAGGGGLNGHNAV